MMDWVDGGPAGPLVMMLVMVVLTILLVVGVVLGINALYPSRGQGNPRLSDQREPHPEPLRGPAEDELELRYARGEIDAETLAQRRAVLRQR